MSTRVAIIVSIVLTAAAGAYFGWVYSVLPEQIPSHWNVQGEVDGWTPKGTLAWAMPLLMLGLAAFMAAAQWLSPRGWDVQPFRPTFNLIVVIIVAMIGYIWVVSAIVGMRPEAEGGRLVVAGLLVFIAVMGNFLGKVRRNFWMGLRLPWTLASDRVWVATHRLAARLLTAAGAIGAVAVLAGAPMVVAFGGLLAAVAIPCVYSLVLYKRQGPPAATAVAVMIAGVALAVGVPAARVEAQPAAGDGVAAAGREKGEAKETAAAGATATATEVTFVGAGGLELRGTLLMPAVAEGGEGQRVPAAVLLPGSGPPDRDGNIRPVLVTDILKQIAERLAEEGIATLRYDKRSAAGYAGVWPKDVGEMSEFFAWENFVGDAKAAAAFLREQGGWTGGGWRWSGTARGG